MKKTLAILACAVLLTAGKSETRIEKSVEVKTIEAVLVEVELALKDDCSFVSIVPNYWGKGVYSVKWSKTLK